MIVGYIKGYDLCNITKNKLEKEDVLSELINEKNDIKEEIISVLDNNGYAIGLKKKKVLKAVYLFDLNGNVLIFKNKVLAKEIDEKTQQEFEKIITEELKEKMIFEELEKIDWNDIEIITHKKEGFSFLVFLACIVLGIIFDNIGMGMLWGIILGITTRVATVKEKEK